MGTPLAAAPPVAFTPATAAWFAGAFAEPTPAQSGAWAAIAQGRDVLVVAPTGSGKTLAAFLWALDRLASESVDRRPVARQHAATPGAAPLENVGTRVLYVSPLKALAVDVERNLRSPLAGIRREAARAVIEVPDITIGIRTGDTTSDERRRMLKSPPDILITTPESLYLMLTSQARDTLANVDTVILDEVHAVAGTKRGAHLALSLERLDELRRRTTGIATPAQRIGLSATVRPVDEVARFLRSGGDVDIVAPEQRKELDLRIVVPVEDMAALGAEELDPDGSAAADPRRSSIWPHVEERLVDLIEEHRSTIVFANSRGLAERLTARLNETWQERHDSDAVIARAHHGSVSHAQRADIEDQLKSGRLPAVVATSSLELGIDMGAVDLVAQVEAPPSVASGLQRVGRGGHQVGATSHGVFFPKYRGDLLQTAVVVERMREGAIESLSIPRHPLDVLAQQVVAAVAMDDWTVDGLLEVLRGAAPYADLPESLFRGVLDMLAGKYPGEEFAELRPRLVWDRATDTLTARPGAQRLAVTSGGTIPDRGLYPVYVVGTTSRVGELDEEMVHESRVGDVFALGASAWRLEEITHDRVWVSPAPGQPARAPFWHGDAVGRPVELGRAVGAFLREVGGARDPRAILADRGLDAWAADNLAAYLAEQRAATGSLPDDRTIVVERFRDELGDWRVAVHTPFGARVHGPWALAIGARLREEFGVEPHVLHSDDGIVIRLPDTVDGEAVGSVAELLLVDPEEIGRIVTTEVGSSALFAGRFRECAARSLLLPRRTPGRRSPLWQQRQRSAHLLSVAARYPDFPVVLETLRECVQDVYDLPALVDLLRQARDGRLRIIDVATERPSPFAQSLLFGYVAAFLYEGDAPLAERRAAALTLDSTLLEELLGRSDLRDLLDPEAIADVASRVGARDRSPRHAEDVADLLRTHGPFDRQEAVQRAIEPDWLDELVASRRAISVRIDARDHWAAVEDAGRLRDALGVALPPGIPDAFLDLQPDGLTDLLARHARTHGPFTAAEAAARYGIGPAVAADHLERLERRGRIVRGGFRADVSGTEWCDAEVLRAIRRRSVAALRSEAEPVPAETLALLLPEWQGLDSPSRGGDALLAVIDQLAGVPLPASQLESHVLPDRVRDYSPAMLDELTSSGEVVWWGAGGLPGGDGWVCLAPRDLAPLLVPPRPGDLDDTLAGSLLGALGDGGGRFAADLLTADGSVPAATLADTLWGLVWQGLVTNDTLAPLRAGIGARGSRVSRPAPAHARRRLARRTRVTTSTPARVAGRWSLLPAAETSPTSRALALAEGLLARLGIVTRPAVASSGFPGGFAAAYRVLGALEESGACRRTYALEGLGGAQFAVVTAVDRVRELARTSPSDALRQAEEPRVRTLPAADPAQPYGASLGWPERAAGHRPSRAAGALVTTVGAAPQFFLDRGMRSLLTWPADDPELLAAGAASLARAALRSHGAVTLQRIDGEPALSARGDVVDALLGAGFARTPSGLRLRRDGRPILAP